MMSSRAPAVGGRPQSKMLGLELVRFGCALAVLIWHYQHFYQTARSPAYVLDSQPLYGLLAPFYAFGQFGVQIFWAISGYIFFWKYGESIASGVVGGSRFFWLRFSRLYPLHFVTLIFVAALQPVHVILTGAPFVYPANDLPHFVLQLGMATDWFGLQPYSFNGPIWSVSAEVFVYAAFFVAIRRFGNSAILIAGVMLLSLAGMVFAIASPPLACAGYFFGGGAAARIAEKARANVDVNRLRLVSAALVVSVFGLAWRMGPQGELPVLRLALMLAAPPLMLLAAQDWRVLERWERPIQAAGNLTYSSYLCHFPLQLTLAIAVAVTGATLPVQSPLFLIGYLGVTMIIAHYVFGRFERPAQNWIRSLTLRRKVAALD